MKKFWSRVFENCKFREDTKMKSCFCFQEKMIRKGDSQQLQLNHYCGLFIILLNFSCIDFNVKLKIMCCH